MSTRKEVILVDVDLTIVRSDLSWLAWLNYKSGKNLTLEDCNYDYDLGKYYQELDNPYKFWCQDDLYDDLVPIEGAVGTLRNLSWEGFDIVFASYCKKGHFGSKYAFLKNHFPFMKGFHATKEKHQIIADYFIDDRHEFLNKRVDGCNLIKYNTGYSQNEDLAVKAYSGRNWEDVHQCIIKKEVA